YVSLVARNTRSRLQENQAGCDFPVSLTGPAANEISAEPLAHSAYPANPLRRIANTDGVVGVVGHRQLATRIRHRPHMPWREISGGTDQCEGLHRTSLSNFR